MHTKSRWLSYYQSLSILVDSLSYFLYIDYPIRLYGCPWFCIIRLFLLENRESNYSNSFHIIIHNINYLCSSNSIRIQNPPNMTYISLISFIWAFGYSTIRFLIRSLAPLNLDLPVISTASLFQCPKPLAAHTEGRTPRRTHQNQGTRVCPHSNVRK